MNNEDDMIMLLFKHAFISLLITTITIFSFSSDSMSLFSLPLFPFFIQRAKVSDLQLLVNNTL